jgi:hypothetical protein
MQYAWPQVNVTVEGQFKEEVTAYPLDKQTLM